jgi:hypothetical protein
MHVHPRRNRVVDASTCAPRNLLALLLPAALFGIAHQAQARITDLQITKVESPAFAGASFGSVGQYETLTGVAHGEVDPKDPRNAIITDIELAPRNARGMVEYSMDVVITKPIDMSRGNGTILHDSTRCPGRAFTRSRSSRSASRGCSTVSKSRSPARCPAR